MIWPDDVSFDGYQRKKDEWFNDPECFLGDPPIDAQYALDLIFKTLIDNKEHYPYLTTMLELILKKYSHSYRKYLRSLKKE